MANTTTVVTGEKASLNPERHPKATRDAFTGKIVEIVDLIAAQAGKGSARQRRKRAIAVYGLMVGALQLARAVNDRKLSDEILESAASAALSLAGAGSPQPS